MAFESTPSAGPEESSVGVLEGTRVSTGVWLVGVAVGCGAPVSEAATTGGEVNVAEGCMTVGMVVAVRVALCERWDKRIAM